MAADAAFRDWVHGEHRRFRAAKLFDEIEACEAAHPGDAAQVMCLALDHVRARLPAPLDPWGNAREEAEFWADIATPAELEAYAAAALRKIERGGFAEAARKRILALMWGTLSDDDRRAFLARVDPQGKFRGRP